EERAREQPQDASILSRSRAAAKSSAGAEAIRPVTSKPMLLTISTTQQPSTDLGFLLHKNPAHVQSEELPFGRAHVFYPSVGAERCTGELFVEADAHARLPAEGV